MNRRLGLSRERKRKGAENVTVVGQLSIVNESYCQDLRRVERLNSQLMMWATALEGHQDNLIEASDSPPPILILAPGRNLLVEIVDGTNNDVAQAIIEDRAEVGVRRVTAREGGVFRITGEIYKEGEDIMDVLCRVETWDQKIPRYPEAPPYNDLNYIPDRQV